MLVYLADKKQFTQDIESGTIDAKIQAAIGQKVGDSERRAWNNSLVYMNLVLNHEAVPNDVGIGVELKIPQTSKRIDVILSGVNEFGTDNAVIVELKQWDKAQITTRDGIVKTFVGGALRDMAHPSYQAWSYASLLKNFNETVYTRDVELRPCAFLHNYAPDGVLTDASYQPYLERAPLFGKGEISSLREFIRGFIRHGDGGQLIIDIQAGRIRPSKRLSDQVASKLEGNEEFIMIDDQKVAFETILNLAATDEKTVVIVEGGPGTGKSVVAINLLTRLLQQRLFACYVTKNSAPREVYAAKLSGTLRKTEISSLFLNSGKFINTDTDTYDVLLVDEAHRLNQKSGLFKNLGVHQIQEIVSAARVSVFFLDEDQRVTLKDIGSKDEIRRLASEDNARVVEMELNSQFRCNGEDGYLAWIDDVLQIRETANQSLTGIDFDFRVYGSPSDLFNAVFEKNEEANRSRVVAGYCWDWKSKKAPKAYDIEFPAFNFRKRWNLTKDGMLWLIAPRSIHQIGCIHTCQGLELDYVGVIIGNDLVVRNGSMVCQPENRARQDRSILGWKKLLKENPEDGPLELDRIIKNTYRTLMTRGMKGCYVYSTDEETQWYLRSRVGEIAQ